MDIIRSQTNSANDSSGSVWGLPGNTFIALVLSLIFSVCLVIFLMTQHFNNLLVLPIASLPTGLTIAYIGCLVIGRPKGYAIDLLDQLIIGKGISLNPVYQPHHPMKPKEDQPHVIRISSTKRLFRR
jgi:hypothetical protein